MSIEKYFQSVVFLATGLFLRTPFLGAMNNKATKATDDLVNELMVNLATATNHINTVNNRVNELNQGLGAAQHQIKAIPEQAAQIAQTAARQVQNNLQTLVTTATTRRDEAAAERNAAQAARDEANQALGQVNQAVANGRREIQNEITRAEGKLRAQRRTEELALTKEKIRLEQEALNRRAQKELQDKKRQLELETKELVKRAKETAEANVGVQMQVEAAKVKAEAEIKAQEGIYAQQFEAQKEMNKEKWASIERMLKSVGAGLEKLTNDPARLARIVGAIAATGVAIYGVKHFMPVLVAYLIQPRVVSETSKKSLFGWTRPRQDVSISNLTFAPELQAQLRDLAAQIKTAKLYDETCPNALFWGEPGTGKTAFAKALAYESGMDYALTSGSEFAKITDLNLQNSELRKLIEWGQTSKKGVIIFIDEAESLFANRKLPTTSKQVQDFINTFLAIVPEKSQKNLMFIFATNHPFKLDDAIANRVGASIEFILPGPVEREQILGMYLEQFAAKNPDAVVKIDLVNDNIATYAQQLEGLAPRAIKFVAEQMIVRARRQEDKALTDEIATSALKEAVQSQAQVASWEKEREQWLKEQLTIGSRAAAAAA